MSSLLRGSRFGVIPVLNLYTLCALGMELIWRSSGEGQGTLALLMLFSQWWLLPSLVLAPLAFLLGWRRTALGLGLVALLFLAVYGRPFLYAPRPAAEHPNRLTVATLNVGAFRVDAATIAAAARATNADLVVMQEIVDPYVPDVRAALLDAYPHQVYRGGKGVLSRWPLGEPQVFETSRSPGRPHLETRIVVDGQVIKLLAPHPYPPTDVPLIYGDGSYRPHPNSIVDAAELAARASASGEPILLVGDLNFAMRTSAYQAMHRAGLQDAFQTAGDGFGATWPSGFSRFGIPVPPLVRIDYVWHSKHFTTLSARTGSAYGSDHLPVIATLAW